MLAVILVFVLLTLLTIIVTIFHKRNSYAHIKSPPITRLIDFIPGHANGFKRFQKRNPKRTYPDYLRECFDIVQDKTFVFHHYHTQEIWTIDVEKVARILNNNDVFKKPTIGYELFERFCGARFMGRHNLIFNPGDAIWQKKRKLLDAVFHRKSLKQTYENMKISTRMMIESIKNSRRDNETLNIHDFLFSSTLDTICRAGFSIDEDASNILTVKAIDEIYGGLDSVIQLDLLFILPFFNRKLKTKIKNNIICIRNYLKQHLVKRISNAEDMKWKNDILAHMIRANTIFEGFGTEEIVDDLLSFILAGTETTSSAASFFLRIMLDYPEICEKVRNEIDAVYDGRTEIEYEELNKLEYMEQCIKETLRIYSVTLDSNRVNNKPVTVDGLFIPKGTMVSLNTSLINREPSYWGPHPDKFNPENFARDKTIKPFTYLPFMAGTRTCIAKHFAMMELKIMLSKLLLNFELENPHLNEPERMYCKSAVTQRPLAGVPAYVKER